VSLSAFVFQQMAIVAVHCAKTLAIAASGSELLRACVRLLLPALIQYVAKMVPRVDEGTVSEQQAISIDEVWKTFATLVSLAKDEQRQYQYPRIWFNTT
jgi:hypothetical protein